METSGVVCSKAAKGPELSDELRNETPVQAVSRVLIADDENLVAVGIASCLEALEIEVVGPVADGRSAVELCRREPADLALLDIRMPVMDGLDAAEALWNELRVPSIIVSAFGGKDFVDRAQRAGVFAYLLKPVSPESLRAAISIAWAKYRLQLEQDHRIEELEENLSSRREIEAAKWRIISQTGCAEPEAHALMQKSARNERRRLVDIAREILSNPDHPHLKR